MASKKKLTNRQFARKFADIAEEALGHLPPEEQDRRIAAFERAVARVCARGSYYHFRLWKRGADA